MLAFKRLVTILVMVYLLLALLFVFSPAARDTFASAFNLSGDAGLATFYNTLFLVGAVLLGLQLVVENLDSALLRRETAALNGKINELKAKLYDHQLDQREREFQQRPAPTPTTVGATTIYQSAPVPAPAMPTSTPAHDVEHPTFPQSDPGLMNAPVQQPNTIIPPSPPTSLDNRAGV
ncbi:hypothetical protein [Hymenobacter elongatus]|uniref:LapA family protein n=1 Tax=Hymenobacter elongatus TaxID=877208 RepID=A0A4Z0PI58_9BACT|nr:hypothetical protein [Hymenobacter elongatus]TGE14829.1 hypothetical protein E5J99_14475 [Hymenobacter elongatus]